MEFKDRVHQGRIKIMKQDKLNRLDIPSQDTVLLPDIHYTVLQFKKALFAAEQFLNEICFRSLIAPELGLIPQSSNQNSSGLEKSDIISFNVIRKIGGTAFIKRRPEDIRPFISYVERKLAAQEPLLFRVGFGSNKNVNLYPEKQSPDCAEYLTIVQLLRLMKEVAFIYPFGVKAQIVPDDLRGAGSNRCPAEYANSYISGLQEMVRRMDIGDALSVESGQARLYNFYNVDKYKKEAALCLSRQVEENSLPFGARWLKAQKDARENLPKHLACFEEQVKQAAFEYLVLAKAEAMSGLWQAEETFPLRYANHSNSYQIYTLGFKKTKLPWQICLDGREAGFN
jgi:hypothetical protein